MVWTEGWFLMALPIFHTDNLDFTIMQNNWSKQLNPLLANPCNQSIILKSVSLASGSNVVNHLLGKKLQGWKIIRQRASASIYDTQDSNQSPQLTLLLTSSAPVVVDLEVF